MPLVTLDDCLGQPDNWINILQESGVLSAIDADLVFWQTKPSLTNPQLRATRFTSAASFLVAAAQQKQIPWRTFRKELSGNLMMLRELDFRLGITSAATSQSAMSAALTGSPSSEPEALAVGTLLWTNLDVLWRVVPDVRPAAWNEGMSAFLSWFHTNVAQGKLLDKIGRSLKYAANYQSDMEAKELCVALRYVYHLISSQSPFAAKFALSAVVADMSCYDPPTNKWPNLQTFKALLYHLECLGVSDRMYNMLAMTPTSALLVPMNLNFPPNNNIKGSFTLWFFYYYNQSGPLFAKTFWQVLRYNLPNSTSAVNAIKNSDFSGLFMDDPSPESVYSNQMEVVKPILSKEAAFAACVQDLAEIPTIQFNWNTWLAAEKFTIFVGQRWLKMTDLPRFTGNCARDFVNYLLTMYNNDKKHLFLVGELFRKNNTGGALDAIAGRGVEEIFFRPTGQLDELTGVSSQKVGPTLSQAMEWTSTKYNPMYEGLNSKWSSLSDERKDARIDSILKSAEIAAKIREQAPYLLPGNATLADWRKNLSGAWVGLIKVLIEWAERKLARDFTTYPVSDVRVAMKKALEAVEQRASLKELVIFSPTMTAADREIAWPATASNFIKQKDMAIWLNEPEMVNEDLSQEEVNLMFKQLMEKEACGPDLRIPILKTAYDYITQLPVAERWPMLEPHEFMDSFFKPPAAGGPSRDLNFTVNTD